MSVDPERWTNNTKSAFSAATAHAASANNPELTPGHLLDALLQQQETMTRPLLTQVGVDPAGPEQSSPRTAEPACPEPRVARSRRYLATPAAYWKRLTRVDATWATVRLGRTSPARAGR